MPPSKQCVSCRAKFATQFFRNSSHCRFCRLQSELEKLHDKYDDKCKQYDDLSQQFEALKDFVSSNVACPPSADTAPATSAAVHATATDVATPSPTPRAEAPFLQAKNRSPPITKKRFLPISTYNRFKVLAEEEEDALETRLVGDSIIRPLLTDFCGRARVSRRRLCMPGGCLDDITAACDEAASGTDNNALFVIHAGTNDVEYTRSEELMEKYRRMIQQYKTKSHNIIISGILPRTKAPSHFYDRAFSTNSRLKSLCTDEGVDYVNLWDDFYNKPLLFQDDGLHLNAVGSARFGRLLSNKVSSFRPKNCQQDRAASST